MTIGERIFIGINIVILLLMSLSGIMDMDPRDYFFNECSIARDGNWICIFSWRETTSGIILAGYTYIQWIFLINAGTLRKFRGEPSGHHH